MKTPESVSSDRERQRVQTVAADWVARRHAGLRPDEEAELQHWLKTDPIHAEALAEHAAAWALVNRPRLAGQADLIRAALAARQARTSRRRRWFAGFATAGLAAAAALVLIFTPARVERAPSSPTIAVRPNIQVLPDGSRVELGSAAEIAVDFTAAERGVRLVRGEALFEVTKNPARPFIVSVDGVRVRAVGTAFSVRYAPGQVDVLVTEGKVQVRSAAPDVSAARPATQGVNAPVETDPTEALLGAGQRAVVSLEPSANGGRVQVVTLSATEIAQALAWRGRRVEFTDTPLAEAVQIFNQRNRVQLLIADPVLKGRCITGIFWSDDPDGFIRLLESGVDVRAERSSDQIVLRAAK